MANWFDIISLIIVAAIFVGVIVGVMIAVNKISEAVDTTKQNLKTKGVNISTKGVSVKTSARFNREDYVDATQRQFIKAMGAASFGTADNDNGGLSKVDDEGRGNGSPDTSSPRISTRMSRQNSGLSTGTGGSEGSKKEKKHKFGAKSK